MPIYANKESLDFWNNLANGKSRALAATRFVTIAKDKNDNEWRKASCEAIKTGVTLKQKTQSFNEWLFTLDRQGAKIVFAKLEARLIVDSAGGVLENGGICLDRNSGIPFIPGSAVKGAARHYAIYELSEETDHEKKIEILYRICRVFGYGKLEWTKGRNKTKGHSHSDFWLAMTPLDCGDDELRDKRWADIADKVADKLFKKQAKEPEDRNKPVHAQLPAQAGCVCFLPAYPDRDPRIDIDVLTCHHSDYYSDKKNSRTNATDDEAPNPVLFPTVAAGVTLQFPLVSTVRTEQADLEAASAWLKKALEIFGLGAKTNVGYGWFSVDNVACENFKQEVDRRKKQAKIKATKEKMSPYQLILYELEEKDNNEFITLVREIEGQSEEEQKAICELLAGAKSDNWKAWNKSSAKKWQPRLPGIREIAMKHGIHLP